MTAPPEYPAVTVITPAYNCDRLIVTCIESVQAQTFSNWEMVIVDDGSTDSTFERASAQASGDDRITILRHPDGGNHGVSASRNLAVATSRAPLLAFLDADDEWLPDKIARQTEALNSSSGFDLAFSKAACIDLEGKAVRHPDWPQMDWELGHAPAPGPVDEPFEGFISGRIGIPTLTVVASKEAVVEAGLFPPGLRFQVEDAVLWGKVLRTGKALFVNDVLARYRVHQENFTSSLDALATVDSYWELYNHLGQDFDHLPVVLTDAMAGCIDRYLTARGASLSDRWGRARSVANRLTGDHGTPTGRIAWRFFSAWPRHLKMRTLVGLRRLAGIGPTPWRSLGGAT